MSHEDFIGKPTGAGTIHMAVGPHGYVGAARLEDGRLNIAAAFDRGNGRVPRGAG